MKKGKLHIRLLIYYGCLITAIIFVIFFSFYFYVAGSLEERSAQALNVISTTVSARLDDTVKQLSKDTTRLLYSEKLKSLFYSDKLYSQSMDSLSAQRDFNNTFYEIMGPQFPASQINIFREDGHYISIGNYTAFDRAETPVKDSEWFRQALEAQGSLFLTPPHLNDWSYYHRPVFSLYRSFSPRFGKKNNAVIEIQYDYSALEDLINNMNISQQVYILDKNGNFFYPWEDNGQTPLKEQIFSCWQEIHTLESTGTFTSREKNIISYTNSGYTGLTVLVPESEYVLSEPVRSFRNNLIFIGLTAFLATLLVSYFIAHKVTVPVRQLYTSVQNLNLDTLGSHLEEPLSGGWDELELLNSSFLEMKSRLEQSLEEAISSKSHELQARLLALQSQMNPHFLYNTLTTISIMSENAGCTDITDACNSLSSMLRYISGDEPGLVTIRDEIMHTQDFLNLIKIRYRENIHYDIHIPKELLQISIPKMVVEPLAENCVKYAMNGPAPWGIAISGRLTDAGWEIFVQDNGKGFPKEKLEELYNTFTRLNPQKEIPNLKLNGMGLINIFIRLKLIYGEAAVFSIKNMESGGACVTIGGPLSPG